jgi:hypothetical protein
MTVTKKSKTVDNDDVEVFDGPADSPSEENVSSDGAGLFKLDSDLFKDESYIVHKMISVKRTNSAKYGENWDILEDKKVILRLKGDRFSNKEKEFLRTVDGVKFVVNGYKSGWNSINKFKQQIKEHCDNIQGNKKAN